jgi:hypothetical protein
MSREAHPPGLLFVPGMYHLHSLAQAGWFGNLPKTLARLFEVIPGSGIIYWSLGPSRVTQSAGDCRGHVLSRSEPGRRLWWPSVSW